jgi:hypothetical protein
MWAGVEEYLAYFGSKSEQVFVTLRKIPTVVRLVASVEH